MSAAPKDASEAAPKKKSKLLVISIAAVVVLGAGGGGAWFFLKPKDPNAVHAEPPKPAVFMPLETFTVNLVPQDGQPQQYLQAGLTLKLGEEVKEASIKDKMPEIRDRILMVLSSKKASDVLPAEGKKKLAKEIVAAVQSVAGLSAAPAKAAHAAPAQAEPAPGEAAAAEVPKKKAAAKAEHDEAEGKAEAKEGEAEAEAAPAPKPVKKAAAAPQIEVLFTSFIVQ
jgi:flagellar FliL protein